jgi:thioredoxin-like negative regulator of GroEL
MSMAELAEATRENFHDLVADGLVMVDVWGPECKPCLALMPHVARIADERPELRVIKLEAPKARRVCIELKVHGLPTFLLMRDGEEISRLSASQLSPTQLREWLDGQLEVSQAG